MNQSTGELFQVFFKGRCIRVSGLKVVSVAPILGAMPLFSTCSPLKRKWIFRRRFG